jgi:hypothetical protein
MERRIPGFMPAKMPYHRSSLIKDVALSTAPKYTPGPRFGGSG